MELRRTEPEDFQFVSSWIITSRKPHTINPRMRRMSSATSSGVRRGGEVLTCFCLTNTYDETLLQGLPLSLIICMPGGQLPKFQEELKGQQQQQQQQQQQLSLIHI